MDTIIEFILTDPLIVYLSENPFIILLLFGLFVAAIGHIFMAPKPYRG